MVRIKRNRRRKLFILAAACLLGTAALVASLVFFFVSFRERKVTHDTKQQMAAEEVFEAAEVKAEEETPEAGLPKAGEISGNETEEYAAGVPSEEDEETGDEVDEEKAPDEKEPLIDDDSLQDENSVVQKEMDQGDGVKRSYLTFDDGPSIYTDEIIDILNDYGVHATFFVCGTGDTDESLRHVYKRIVENGNTIGMHSYSHIYSRVYGDLDLFQYDLDKIRNLIYNETGVVPRYYRFPGGSGNTIASLPMIQYISVLYSQGMEYYDWNVYCGDSSGRSLSSREIVKNTLDGVDRRRTSVILLHDTGSRRSTVDALPGILDGLIARGADIRPIDDETPPLHQFDEAKEEKQED